MKTKILLFISLLTYGVKGQNNPKVYKGEFEGGTGSYQYYENQDEERVKHGSYFLKISTGVGNLNYNRKIEYVYSGNYTNGLKTGEWTEKKYIYDPSISVGITEYDPVSGRNVLTDVKYVEGKGIDELTEVRSTYKDGKLNGRFSSVTYIFQKGVKGVKTEVKCEFNQNCFINEYSFSNGDVIIQGKFSSKGLMTGDWKYKRFDEMYSMKYHNGFIVDLTKRNKQGELVERYSNYKPYHLDKLPQSKIEYDTIKHHLYSVKEEGVNSNSDDFEEIKTKTSPNILCNNKLPIVIENVDQDFSINLDLNLLGGKDINHGYYNEIIITLNNGENLKETIYGLDRNETDIRNIINDSSEMYRKEISELNSYDLKIPEIKTELNTKLYWLERDPNTRDDTTKINPIKRKLTELDTLKIQIRSEITNLETKISNLHKTNFNYSKSLTQNIILNKWLFSDTTTNISLTLSSIDFERENEREESKVHIKGEIKYNIQNVSLSFEPDFTDNLNGLTLGTDEPNTYIEVYPDIVVFILKKKLRTSEYFLFKE